MPLFVEQDSFIDFNGQGSFVFLEDSWFSNYHTLIPGKGYLVFVENSLTMLIRGRPLLRRNIIIPGKTWSNFGVVRHIYPRNIDATFVEQDSFIDFNDQGSFVFLEDSWFSNSHALIPGKGYLVFVENTLIFEG